VLQLVLSRLFDGVVRTRTATPARPPAARRPHRSAVPDRQQPFTVGSSLYPA
jgi:hypothetical protein